MSTVYSSGVVTAYGAALQGGYTGSYQSFCNLMATLPTDNQMIKNMIANAYSASRTYSVGDYVWQGQNLYICRTAIETPEAWTQAHWSIAVVGNDLRNISSEINNITVTNNPALNSILPELYTVTDLSAAVLAREYNNYQASTSIISGIRFYDSDGAMLLNVPLTTPGVNMLSDNLACVFTGFDIESGAYRAFSCRVNPCVYSIAEMPTLYAEKRVLDAEESITENAEGIAANAAEIASYKTALESIGLTIYNNAIYIKPTE